MNESKVMPTTYLFAAIILILAVHFIVPIVKIVSFPWPLIGLLPLFLGIALNIIADNAFKRNKTTVKPFEDSAVLIKDGVFRISRHPMYLGFVLILIGEAILLGSVAPYIIIIGFIILMHYKYIKVEETMLEKQFGKVWSVYRDEVRRWF